MTRVLVVDDVPDNVKLLAYVLEDFGYEVDGAGDGAAALRAARDRRPDVILLDVTMPGLDGIEVCRRLKADPELRAVPVLMLSARGEDDDVVRGLDAGAQDYVVKPFHEKVLLARVRAAARAKADHDTIQGLNRRLEALASRDGLTGAMNRRYLEEALGRVLALARRQAMPVSLLLLDVDHFKAYNDRLGHLAGDDLLRRLVAALGPLLRAHDILARYGGEEFAALLPATGGDAAAAIAERMRAAIAALPGSLRRVTASFGVATAPDGLDTPEGLLGRADRALYRAKHAGRDRVARDGDACVPALPAPA